MGYELNFVEGECITLSHIGNVYLVEHQQALDEAASAATFCWIFAGSKAHLACWKSTSWKREFPLPSKRRREWRFWCPDIPRHGSSFSRMRLKPTI